MFQYGITQGDRFSLTISAYANIFISIVADIRDILFAFSEEIRVRIILLLKDSAICVTCLTDIISLPQSTISRHLALLRRTGVVEMTKDRLHCYYTVNRKDPFGSLKKGIVKTFYRSLKDKEPFKADFKRLRMVMDQCSAGCKVRL